MVSQWRQAGLNYLQFSSVCAKALRRCLKPELRADALRKEESLMKVTKWKDGKPAKESKQIQV